MAICYASLSVIGLGQQRQFPIAMAAYIEREKAYDERTETSYDFTKQDDDLVTSSILLPPGADKKFLNFQTLWNEAVDAEKNKDKRQRGGKYKSGAQFCYDVILALSKELNLAQQKELVEKFIQDKYISKKVGVQYAIHHPQDKQKEDNPHAHLLVTTREINGDHFGKKQRKLNPKFFYDMLMRDANLGTLAPQWIAAQNKFFIENRLYLEVDSPQLYPQKKQKYTLGGSIIKQINEARNDRSKQDIGRLDILLGYLEERYAYFHKRELDLILRLNGIENLKERQSITERLVEHPDVLKLETHAGEEHFTTIGRRRKDLHLSSIMQQMAKKSNDKNTSLIGFEMVVAEMMKDGQDIDREKIEVVRNLMTSPSAINGIKGKAGTGKSFTIDILRRSYEKEGFNLIGVSPTHSVKNDLTESGFEITFTAASLALQIKNGWKRFKKDDVIIIDEAGMLATDQISPILERAYKDQVKVILVGDDRQLPAIGAGGAFSELRLYSRMEELHKVYRQKYEGDRVATALFSRGKLTEALEHYKDKEIWTDETVDETVKQWNETKCNAVLAFKNETVRQINSHIQDLRLSKGEIMNPLLFNSDKGEVFIGQNDQIILTDHIKEQGLTKGDRGIVLEANPKLIKAQFKDKIVKISPEKFGGFYLGYALTVHQSQGQTYDNVLVVADSNFMWSKELSCVAYTRHKDDLSIIIDKDEFKNCDDYLYPHSQMQGMSTQLRAIGHEKEEENIREVWNKINDDIKDLAFLERIEALEMRSHRIKDPTFREKWKSAKRVIFSENTSLKSKIFYIRRLLGKPKIDDPELLKAIHGKGFNAPGEKISHSRGFSM